MSVVDIVQHNLQIESMSSTPVSDAASQNPRQRLVDAAFALLTNDTPRTQPTGRATRATSFGAEALGIRAVAEAAGLTHAAPLHHFPDRISLLAAVAAEGQRRLAGVLQETRSNEAGSGARRMLGAVVREHSLFAARWPALWDVMNDPQLMPLATAVWRGRQAGKSASEVLASELGPEATRAAAKRLSGRAAAVEELVDAQLLVAELYRSSVDSIQAGALVSSALRPDDRRPLVAALTAIADGLALQFAAERTSQLSDLANHAELTVSLLLTGLVAD